MIKRSLVFLLIANFFLNCAFCGRKGAFSGPDQLYLLKTKYLTDLNDLKSIVANIRSLKNSVDLQRTRDAQRRRGDAPGIMNGFLTTPMPKAISKFETKRNFEISAVLRQLDLDKRLLRFLGQYQSKKQPIRGVFNQIVDLDLGWAMANPLNPSIYSDIERLASELLPDLFYLDTKIKEFERSATDLFVQIMKNWVNACPYRFLVTIPDELNFNDIPIVNGQTFLFAELNEFKRVLSNGIENLNTLISGCEFEIRRDSGSGTGFEGRELSILNTYNKKLFFQYLRDRFFFELKHVNLKLHDEIIKKDGSGRARSSRYTLDKYKTLLTEKYNLKPKIISSIFTIQDAPSEGSLSRSGSFYGGSLSSVGSFHSSPSVESFASNPLNESFHGAIFDDSTLRPKKGGQRRPDESMSDFYDRLVREKASSSVNSSAFGPFVSSSP